MSSFYCLLPHQIVLPFPSRIGNTQESFNSPHSLRVWVWALLATQPVHTIVLYLVGMFERGELKQVLNCDRRQAVHSHKFTIHSLWVLMQFQLQQEEGRWFSLHQCPWDLNSPSCTEQRHDLFHLGIYHYHCCLNWFLVQSLARFPCGYGVQLMAFHVHGQFILTLALTKHVLSLQS